jgi:hypothetical protein
MHIHDVMPDGGSGRSSAQREQPLVPLEELDTLTPEQIALLHDRGILYVQEILAMLANEETRGVLAKYLGLSRRETSALEEEAQALLTPEEVRSLRKPVPRYPLGAEDYRRQEVEKEKEDRSKGDKG